METLDHSGIAGGNVKWDSHSGNQVGSYFKSSTYAYYMTQFAFLDIYHGEIKDYIHTKTCM